MKKERGPFQFAWATLVCSSFAGSNGVGGHLENQGKHAGGSQAIWDWFRPSRLLHSVTTLPLFILLPKDICAHTQHTHNKHSTMKNKKTWSRVWLTVGETTTKTFWHNIYKYPRHFLFYFPPVPFPFCPSLAIWLVDTFLFHQCYVFHHFLPFNNVGILEFFHLSWFFLNLDSVRFSFYWISPIFNFQIFHL